MNIQQISIRIKEAVRNIAERTNTAETVTFRGKTVRIKPGRVIIVFAALLVLIIVLSSLVGLLSDRVKTVDISVDTGGDYTAVQSGGDMILYNKQHMMAINSKGKLLWKTNTAMSQPVAETAGKYVLVYDLGGKNYAALYKNGECVTEYNLGNDIISAKVNKNGDTVFATDTVGYKGNVKVFDKKGNERFSWNSGDGYILDAVLKNGGRQLAIAQFRSDTDKAASSIQFIDIPRKKLISTTIREESVISEIRYCRGKLTVVSDNDMFRISASGHVSGEVSFAGKKPGKYSIANDKTFAFVTEDNRGNTVLELYSAGGRLKGRYQADAPINNFDVCDYGIAAARRSDVLCISSSGKLKKSISAGSDIKSIGVFRGGKYALVIGGTSVCTVRLK